MPERASEKVGGRYTFRGKGGILIDSDGEPGGQGVFPIFAVLNLDFFYRCDAMRARVLAGVALLVLLSWSSRGVRGEQLPSDPRILTGELSNGVKWMYRQHDNPPGKLSLMFHVRSGSLMEKDSQRGLAHFMEHMVFNGSEHFPPGELIPYFESIGMEFGGDINAFTSFDQTAFMIFLPNTELEQIDKALMVLSDQAFRASLLESEIDKERGVILAEKRAGQSAGQRLRDKLWPQIFAGSRFAERMVIGTEEVISSAPRSEFVDYYRTWFRPERLTVFIVGDADPEPVLPLVEQWFGQYQPELPARPAPGAQFKPFTEQRAMVATDPDYERCQVSMFNLLPKRTPATTVSRMREELVENIGQWIIGRRLSERVKKGEAGYHNASGGVMDFFGEATLVLGMADGEPDQWERMLEELVVEISRARQYGFTQRELELAKAELMAGAENAVKSEATRNARGIIMEMVQAVNKGEPLMSAEQELELFQRLLPTIELPEVSGMFERDFAPGTFAYAMQMPEKAEYAVPTAEQLLATARAALARQIEPPKNEQRSTQLLESEPRPGQVIESNTDEELQVTNLLLDNGVRVHHRFMDYKKNLVLVSISLGGARLEETAANAGVTEVAALAFNQPSTKRLTSTEITDILTGKTVDLRAEFRERDSLDILVSGSPEDLETGLQLAYVLLTEGRIEEPAFKQWVETSLQGYERYSKSPQFAVFKEYLDLVSNGDPRFTMKDPERIKAQTLECAQSWLEHLCREAPIEVAVVGELKLADALPLVEKYLGSLPRRNASAARLDPLRKLARGVGPLVRRVEVETITPQAMVLCGFVGSSAKELQDTRALELAAKTLDSRLIERVREELGLVYSIGVQVQASEVFDDFGAFLTGAPCAPDKADELVGEIEALFEKFAAEGPTDDELANAKKQILNNLDTRTKEPSYWWGELQYLDLHKLKLDNFKKMGEAYEAFTREQVLDAFRKYYQPQRQYRIIAVPVQVAKPSDATEEKAEVPAAP